MLRLIPVLRVLGGVFLGLALFMIPPLVLALALGEVTASYFVMAILAALFIGGGLLLLGASSEPFSLTRSQAFLSTGLSWTLAPALAAIPFAGVGAGLADAYFEAASGITTTGSTVFAGLDEMPRSILLWRSLLQWIGGIGIIVLGILVMPFLRIGGMQLFHTESSDSSEKIFARSFVLAQWLAAIYIGLTLICAGVYAALGMSGFDAINHAMTTIATGGYSTHDASFGYFNSAALEWTGFFFMLSGGVTFVAYIRMVRGQRRPIYTDVQVRAFLVTVGVAALALALTHSLINKVPFFEALRLAAFNVGSIITTTGYASTDYQLWGPFAVAAFFVLTFIGGCSGSTTGGIKIYRFQILAKLANAYLTRLVSPSQVRVITYGSRRVDEEVAIAVLTFLIAFLFSVAALTLVLGWMGLDFLTALSSAAQAIANVGPGLGDVVGPAGNFGSLPDAAKAVLAFAMIMGRLEFFTLLVMLTPAFWRG